MEDVRNDRYGLVDKRGTLNGWFDHFGQEQRKVRQTVSTKAVEDPEEALKELASTINQIRQDSEQLTNRQQSIEKRRQQLNDLMMETRSRQQKIASDSEKLEEKWSGYLTEEESVRSRLAQYECYTTDLFVDQDKICLYVRDRWQSMQEERVCVQAELAGLEEKWTITEGKNYYVPHHDLLKLKQRLERYDLSVVLGSEWLAGQPISEEEKEQYLEQQPLLPYAILIEENQLSQVKQALKQVQDMAPDMPLLFLVKSSLRSVAAGRVRERFLPIWQDELYLYRPDSLRMYTSSDYLQRFKANLKDKIEETTNVLQDLKRKEHDFSNLKHRVENFYRHFSKEKVTQWQNEKSQLGAERVLADKQLSEAETEETFLQAEQDENEKKRHALQKEEQNIKTAIEKVEDYLLWYDQLPAKREAKINIENRIQEIDRRIRELDREHRANQEREKDIEKLEYELRQR